MLDVTGQKFNHLTAIKVAGRDKYGRATWLFRCDCGKEVVLGLNNVRTGNTKSCGCLKHKRSIRAIDLTGQKFGRSASSSLTEQSAYSVCSHSRVRLSTPTCLGISTTGYGTSIAAQTSFQATCSR